MSQSTGTSQVPTSASNQQSSTPGASYSSPNYGGAAQQYQPAQVQTPAANPFSNPTPQAPLPGPPVAPAVQAPVPVQSAPDVPIPAAPGTAPNPFSATPALGGNADPSGWNGLQPGSGWNGINPTPGYLGSINGLPPSASWHGLAAGAEGMIGSIPWATGYGTQNPGPGQKGVGAPMPTANAPTGPYVPPGFIGNINSLGKGYWNAPAYAGYINTVNPTVQQPISGTLRDGSEGDNSLLPPVVFAPTWDSASWQSVGGPGGTPLPYQSIWDAYPGSAPKGMLS